MTLCAATACTCFSQDISAGSSVWKSDTLYSVSVTQLRSACRIFSEHSFLKSENGILTDQISLLNRSGYAKDLMIKANQAQINALNDIVYRKDMIISNKDNEIAGLEQNITMLSRRNWKYLAVGTFASFVIYGVVTVIFR